MGYLCFRESNICVFFFFFFFSSRRRHTRSLCDWSSDVCSSDLDKLSLQVHPDDAYASVHEQAAGGRGKTEMWHAVSALPGAQLLLGLKPGVNEENFREGLASRTLEDLFEAHTVRTGDTFFVPPGTAH